MSGRLLDKLPKMMENPEFSAAWEEARKEFSIAREIIRTRVSEATHSKLRIELVPAGGESHTAL
ncbi:hypothetical protein LJC47_04515 [Desulfosarcina sp. OttesenSCG-928-B08]|nr:hypothetical protein [Desulfosarcina sp. OttesenSCG-928-B08]